MNSLFKITILWGFLGIHLTAAETGKTLRDCFEAALTRSETVAIQVQTIDIAEEAHQQAIGSLLPNISGVASYQEQQSINNTIGGALFPSSQPLVKLTATQPLFQGFKEISGLRQSNRLKEASEWDKEKAVLQLYLDTSNAFFLVLTAEQDALNLKTEIDLYAKRIVELQQFERLGRSRPSEVLSAQAYRASLAAQLEQIYGQLRAHREVLSFLTGWPVEVSLAFEFRETIKEKTLDEYLQKLDERPDVKAEIARTAAKDSAITLARAGHLPSIGLSANYYLKRFGSLADVHWDATATFTLPLFSGGVVNAQVGQAVAQHMQAEYTLSKVRRTAIQQMRTYYNNLQYDKKQRDLFAEATRLAEANYKQQTKEYRLGLVKNIDVLQALATFQETKRSLDKTRFQIELDFENTEAAAYLRTAKDSEKL